jgi:hypothetical protein
MFGCSLNLVHRQADQIETEGSKRKEKYCILGEKATPD